MSVSMLVVDDEEPILFAFRQYFSKRGACVDIAQEIEEAQALVSNKCYDVVIADLRLTGIQGAEGLELVTFVRERSRHTKIILLTAYGSVQFQEIACARGADAFLQKPKPLKEIAELIASLVGEECCKKKTPPDRSEILE